MEAHTQLVLAALLAVLLGVPLWLRRVPPNRFYGVRTRATLGDEARWYEVNARCGRDLAIAGVLMMIGSRVIDAMGARWVPELRTLASAGMLVLLLAWVSVRALRRARERVADR
jgi:uncharacterized membrane protein